MLTALTLTDCLQPQWAVPPRVRALITTRRGGVSLPPYGRCDAGVAGPGGLNLAAHVGDDPAHVARNRARLAAFIGAPIAWLEQVHGDQVAHIDEAVCAAQSQTVLARADASVTASPNIACAIMVADCLPVLLCDASGRAVGAAHAGWRGLLAGVIEKTVQRVAALAGCNTSTLHAFLGPAIGPRAFEVGAEICDAFLSEAPWTERDAVVQMFVARAAALGKFDANLYGLARLRLARMGIICIAGGTACTVTEREWFYSYRRDHVTGRMAAMIWLTDEAA